MTWFHHLEDTCRLTENCAEWAGVGLFVMMVAGFLVATVLVRILFYGVFALAVGIWVALIGIIVAIVTYSIYYPLHYTKWIWKPIVSGIVFLGHLLIKISAVALFASVCAYFAGYGYVLTSMYQSVTRIF